MVAIRAMLVPLFTPKRMMNSLGKMEIQKMSILIIHAIQEDTIAITIIKRKILSTSITLRESKLAPHVRFLAVASVTSKISRLVLHLVVVIESAASKQLRLPLPTVTQLNRASNLMTLKLACHIMVIIITIIIITSTVRYLPMHMTLKKFGLIPHTVLVTRITEGDTTITATATSATNINTRNPL